MSFLKESQEHHPTSDDMLLELKRMIKAQSQALAENFEQQTLIEEAPGSLAERSPPHQRPKEPPDQQPVMTPQQGWSLPPSVTNPPLGIKPWAVPRLRLEPPRFDGENASDWIRKIQKYYNHHYTPLDDRLYLTRYLFDPPASDWREYWEETNKGKSWDDFLLAMEQRFDPEFYKPSAVTASPRQFMGTRRTVRDQQKPNRTTACPVADREPDQQPPQRQEEVTQVSDVSQFGAHPLNATSSNIFANVSSSKSIVCDENMTVNMGSTNNSVTNELGFETIIGDENFGTNSKDGDEDGDTVINIAVDCGQPMMGINEVDSFPCMDSSNSYTELEFLGVKTELRLQNCEVDDENNDVSLSVGSEQYIQDPKYAAPPSPLFSDEMMSCLKLHSTLHGMKSCLEHHSLLSIENRDWFTMVHALASDGRSIPPRTVVRYLDVDQMFINRDQICGYIALFSVVEPLRVGEQILTASCYDMVDPFCLLFFALGVPLVRVTVRRLVMDIIGAAIIRQDRLESAVQPHKLFSLRIVFLVTYFGGKSNIFNLCGNLAIVMVTFDPIDVVLEKTWSCERSKKFTYFGALSGHIRHQSIELKRKVSSIVESGESFSTLENFRPIRSKKLTGIYVSIVNLLFSCVSASHCGSLQSEALHIRRVLYDATSFLNLHGDARTIPPDNPFPSRALTYDLSATELLFSHAHFWCLLIQPMTSQGSTCDQVEIQRYIWKFCSNRCVRGKMLRGHVKVHVAQIAASNFSAGITVVEFDVGDHHNYYELSRNKNSWRISDPRPIFIAITANSCRECDMEFASIRLVSGHKESKSIKVMKVSRVAEDDESLSDIRNFCLILRRTGSMTKLSGVVISLFFNLASSDCDVSKQDESKDVARCLWMLVRGDLNSLKFVLNVEGPPASKTYIRPYNPTKVDAGFCYNNLVPLSCSYQCVVDKTWYILVPTVKLSQFALDMLFVDAPSLPAFGLLFEFLLAFTLLTRKVEHHYTFSGDYLVHIVDVLPVILGSHLEDKVNFNGGGVDRDSDTPPTAASREPRITTEESSPTAETIEPRDRAQAVEASAQSKRKKTCRARYKDYCFK